MVHRACQVEFQRYLAPRYAQHGRDGELPYPVEYRGGGFHSARQASALPDIHRSPWGHYLELLHPPGKFRDARTLTS
jgi:hypothetical protein